jgi:photosystem II stability/assembly factor-like uncharacterized protein
MFRHQGLFLFLAISIACSLAAPLPAAPGPVRSIGPEGFVNILRDLRFPDRQDPKYLLALTSYHLWESRDGGGSWRTLTADLVFSGQVGNLAIDPFDTRHLFLVSRGGADPFAPPVLHETRDAGRTWASRPLTHEPAGIGRIYFDTEEPGVLAYSAFFGGSFSTDGGQTWTPLPQLPGPGFNPPTLRTAHRGLFYFTWGLQLWTFEAKARRWEKVSDQAFSISELWGDLTRTGTLFARSGENLLRSTDGGKTFAQILSGSGIGAYREFRQSPWNPSHLAVFTYGGLKLSIDRGSTWSDAEPLDWSLVEGTNSAFDPGSGELLFNEGNSLARRRLDGVRQHFRPRGLYATSFKHVVPENGRLWALASDGGLFRRDAQDGPWRLVSRAPCQERLSVTPWNLSRLYLTCFAGYYVSEDAGATWNRGLDFNVAGYEAPLRILFGPGQPDSTWLLAPLDQLISLEGVSPPVRKVGVVDVLFHPDPADGLLASWTDSLETGFIEWKPGAGWSDIDLDRGEGYYFLSRDPADPGRTFALHNYGGVYFSGDRGQTFQFRGSSGIQGGGIIPQGGLELAVDPADGDHLVAGAYTLLAESFDGGFNFSFPEAFHYSYSVAFDPAARLYNAAIDGLQMRSPAYEACAGRDDNFCARQNRFEMTVEWKTADGATGQARKVETGSQESGLFYFFDANNWELLVKVLDGCGINQRFWVFTAGTTDVEYLLKVEDRWTGKIRTYWNAPGKAAEATTDIDAFASCGTPAPVPTAPVPTVMGAAPVLADGEAPPPLELLGGRFVVTASWTDFAGQQGFGTPTPLRSANSGLFWFFSPDNWEVLVKVLDGCAINDHYWVLAAATTDVGYEIEVGEPGGGPPKTYTNPVGRPSPAQIDLAAFPCRR